MNKFAEINVVSFDADGTLWDFEKVMRHSLHQTLLELNRIDAETAALLDVDKMITIRNRVANELTGKISNLSEIRLEAFKQTFKDISRPDDALAVHLNAVFCKHRFQDIELFDDVLPVLDILRHKYILVMLSNSNSDPEFCGLPGIFRLEMFPLAHVNICARLESTRERLTSCKSIAQKTLTEIFPLTMPA